MVPPAQDFLQKPHRRPRQAFMGIEVSPGADGDLVWPLETDCKPEGTVTKEIGPSAPNPGGAGDSSIVKGHGAMLPIAVQGLMLQPDLGPEPLRLQSLEPHLSPALTHDRRVRGAGIEDLHDGAPPKTVIEQAAAREMDAFGKAVIGAHDCDDGLEGRRPSRRHLQRVIGPPRLAHHSDCSAAPLLPGKQGYDL